MKVLRTPCRREIAHVLRDRSRAIRARRAILASGTNAPSNRRKGSINARLKREAGNRAPVQSRPAESLSIGLSCKVRGFAPEVLNRQCPPPFSSRHSPPYPVQSRLSDHSGGRAPVSCFYSWPGHEFGGFFDDICEK
jgi:hypothetical protein